MRLAIGMTFIALAAAIALLRGGAPERWFAYILAGMLVTDRLGHLLIGAENQTAINGLHLIIDLASFGAMMTVMIGARRLWPIWACSFQLLSVASHATLIMDQLPAVVPKILGIAPSYGILASLLLGSLLHQARLKRDGKDPPWRSSWQRAATPRRSSIPRNF